MDDVLEAEGDLEIQMRGKRRVMGKDAQGRPAVFNVMTRVVNNTALVPLPARNLASIR